MSVHQLIYSSSPSKKVLKSHLYIILRQARKNNKINGVTGLLIYSGRHFFQILEGEKKVVSELFQRISSDKRHSGIQILCENDVDFRSFPSWEMAYATPSAKELATWSGLQSTTTVEATISSLKSEPSRIMDVLLNVLEKSPLS
jgi:hypothetical protein